MNTKYVIWFSLQLLSETFLTLRKTEGNSIIHVHRSSCKVPVMLVRFNRNLNFLYRFSKNSQIPNFMKILPVEPSCSMRKDGRTDTHDEANSRFS